MKRVLSLVLALVMVLGMIPMGFAADQTAGEILKGYKIIEGYENGSLGEDNHLNRAEMMVVLARMMGKGQEAKAFALPSSFTDLEGFGWAVPWIAYAELNEWTAGVGAGKFNPAGEVTLQEAAVFMLKALGYVADTDFTWANAVEVATAKSLLAGVSVAHTNAVKRGELFTVMINTLNTNVKDGSATLGVKLGYMVPPVLNVKSVVAANAKELVVQFNGKVDDVTAEKASNYEIKKNNVVIASTAYTAEVDADDASKVVITLTTPLANGDVVIVKALKSILDEKLKPMNDDVTTVLPVFSDTVEPSLLKAATKGNDVVLTFDDYIQSVGFVKFNGVVYGSTTIDGKTVVLTGANNPTLAAGSYAVSVANAIDVVGNVKVFSSTTLTVTTDTTIPAFVSIKATGEMTFSVTFNKSLAMNPTFTVKKNGYDVTAVAAVSTSDSTKYNVTVSNGVVPVYSTGENSTTLSVAITNIKDSNNSLGAPATTSVVLIKDKVAPTVVVSNSMITANSILVQFSEEITIVDASKVIVTNKDGVRITPTTVATADDDRYGDNTVLKLDFAALSTGAYTINIGAGAVQDVAPVANKNVATVVSVEKSGSTTATFTPGGFTVSTTNVITVNFGRTMTSSAITLSNYKIDGVALPSGTAIYFDTTTEVVKIELPSGFVTNDESYVLSLNENIVSTAGEKVISTSLNQIIALRDNIKPVLLSAKKVNSTTVELTFSEALAVAPADTTWADDFIFEINGVKVVATAVANHSTDAKKLVVTLPAYNVNQSLVVTVDPDNASANVHVKDASLNGNKIVLGTSVTATN